MDSHSSIEDPTSGHASQPNQTGTISSMTRVLSNAAAAGEINAFKNIEKPLDHLFTVTKNTVLHIYITTIVTESESKTIFIKEILDECPSLLWQTNSKNETPLHLAARYGHIEIVSFLIERAKNLYQDPDRGEAAREVIWMTTQEKDTALHEALSHNHLEVATLLIKEDPNYSYFPNDASETPLCIAVERNFRDLVSNVLDNCQSPAFGGPLGRTALHAAVLRDGTDYLTNLFCFEHAGKIVRCLIRIHKMSGVKHARTTRTGTGSSSQEQEVADPMMTLERRMEYLRGRPVAKERPVTLSDFDQLLYEEHSLYQLFEYQEFLHQLSWTEGFCVDTVVQDFFCALVSVDRAPEVQLEVRGVQFLFSTDVIADFLNCPQPESPFSRRYP
ncbi:Ankyrin-3 [Morella rubra]|uniref:Ankyrin-3 n=1 Tax=Morella rubra TaxID=262757 RepID=A0A6A1WRZ4_9ROSI|nr:Ankyrin-3 [Morella rubra]